MHQTDPLFMAAAKAIAGDAALRARQLEGIEPPARSISMIRFISMLLLN